MCVSRAGCDLRAETWQKRRDRLEVLAGAFAYPLTLSPLVEPSRGLAKGSSEDPINWRCGSSGARKRILLQANTLIRTLVRCCVRR